MKPFTSALLSGLLLLAFAAAPRAQDVHQLLLVKGVSYLQSDTNLPILASQPYQFMGSVRLNGAGGVTGASLQLSGGSSLPLSLNGGGDEWHLRKSYASTAGLNGDFPDGTYTFTVNATHDGTRTVPIALGGNFPNIPQATGFNAAQAINPAAPFTLTWNGFVGGTPTDIVRLEVDDASGNSVFMTPDVGEPGALNGSSAASVTLPANTLTPGVTYTAQLTFAKIFQVNSTSYGQGVAAYAGYYSQTQFPLATATPAIVKRFGVVKGLAYLQTSDAPPVTDSQPYKFQAFTDDVAPGLLSASLTLPGGSQRALTAENGDSSPSLSAAYLSQAGLDGDYPPGNYTVTFQTSSQGTHAVTLPLPASTFPAAPRVVNFSAVQSVDPNMAFTIHWNAFPGGTVNDFVQFTVQTADGNSFYQTGSPGETDALNGTATTATIPAHTLATGTTYQVQIVFAKFLGQDTSYGLGFSAYFTQTQVPLATSGIAVAPTLTITQISPSQWHLHANGAMGVNYLIENTSSLVPPVNWSPTVNFNGSEAGFDFDDGVVHGANFYRVRPAN